MTNTIFHTLWTEALTAADRDTYISDWATSSIWEEAPPELETLVSQLGNIWDVAHMTLADIRKHTGMGQAAFAERFCVSRRTIEGWEYKNNCPPHTRLMMAEILGLIDR